MTHAKTGTCAHCGYHRSMCECSVKRNTSGDPVKYSYYDSTWSRDNFALTSRIERHSQAERKFMEEFLPVQGEHLYNYYDRSDIHMQKLVEHSIWYHLYGTKKGVWPCHSSSRYCFICNLCQQVEIDRQIMNKIRPLLPIDKLTLELQSDPNSLLPQISIQKL